MYKHPAATFASSSVFTLETLYTGVKYESSEDQLAHYASRPCSSVMAGILLALEKGFQRLMRSHHPDTESPKFRGELSSSYRTFSLQPSITVVTTHRTNIGGDDSTCSHGHHRRNLRYNLSSTQV